MSKYFPPIHGRSQFHCPYCHVYANQEWEQFYDNVTICVDGERVTFSLCAKCQQPTFWIGEKIVYPHIGMFPPANEDLPDDVKEIYNEAASIANQSPRAACALLRLAVEMLLKNLNETGSINEGIKNLVKKGLDPKVRQSLDVVRVIGNNAVHPGVIEFDDTTDVHILFQLINVIADTLITQPKQIQEIYDNLPEDDRKAIEKRDGQTK